VIAVERVPCGLCGGDAPETVREAPPFAVVRCRGCEFVYLSPRPTPAETERIYERDYFESADGTQPGYASYGRISAALRREAQEKLAIARRFQPPPARLLDHGCGTGVFLAHARDSGYDAFGIDLSQYAVDTLVRDHELPAAHATVESGWGEDASFDIVTSWDVLEHMPDPLATLANLRRVLAPGGILVATTPDVTGFDARVLGPYWYGYTKIPEHYYYYSRDTLAELLRRAGLEPLWFRHWGFVRDLAFGLEKAAALTGVGPVKRLADRLGTTALGSLTVSFPLVDMLVVARRSTDA